jgi:hypothetical protein
MLMLVVRGGDFAARLNPGGSVMFGLIIGTLCLVALFSTLRRGRYHHFHSHGWGRGHHHGHSMWHRGRSRGRRWAMRWLFEELDTTPGQEKAILKSLDTLRENLSGSRGELDLARKEVAEAIGGDVLEEPVLNAALGRVDGLLAKARSELFQVLTEVHTALDGNQRKALAEMIADFRGYRLGYGRY